MRAGVPGSMGVVFNICVCVGNLFVAFFFWLFIGLSAAGPVAGMV